ncbi:TRPM8 channel-associated factor 2 [Vicugna pacos]|uniref:TRPM8 channel-associated factor 2 n=1 Tax=Vicugna pacos TaxID=30538 RepID=A0A6J0ARE7_VICPA|nr:TRPM8 channel-associated factor 2 [Vicugna pacos]
MATTPAAAFEALMSGVTSWDVPKDPIPSELLLTGEAAFPVMVNDQGQVLIAASSYGQGRLVVASHEGYLLEAGLAPFLLNAVGWLCPSHGAPAGVHPSLASLASILQGSGVEAQVQPEPGESLGVYCINAYDDTMTAELIQSVKLGGGLLIGGQAWYWASQHGSDKVLSKFPGNQVTSVVGVYFMDIFGDRGQLKVSKKGPRDPLHVGYRAETETGQQTPQPCTILVEPQDPYSSYITPRPVTGAPLPLDTGGGCMLLEAFGWEPFIQLFAEYQTLSDIPKDNPGKMNLWVQKFSEKVQRN